MKWRTLVLVAVVGALMMAILPAQADHVPAMRVNGNSTCASVGSTGDFSFKIAPVTVGPHTDPGAGGATIFISIDEGEPQPNTFNFSIDGGAVHDAIVKGSAANHYDYAANGGAVTFGHDLTIPNGNSVKHAIFCYDVAQIAGTKFDGTTGSGIPNWEIYLLEDNDGLSFVESTVTDTNGRYSFPDPGDGEYVVCEAAQGPTGGPWSQTGPDNTICPESVPGDGGETTTTGGVDVASHVSLAPAGHAISYSSGDSTTGLDFFNVEGGEPLECGDSVPVPEDGSVSGSFTRLGDPETGCDGPQPAKNVVVGVSEDDVVTFIPRGAGESAYRSTLIFEKSLENFPVLEYDQTDNGIDNWQPVPVCQDPEFQGEDPMVTNATIPAGHTWCVVDLDVETDEETGTMTNTWDLFGRGDPRFK